MDISKLPRLSQTPTTPPSNDAPTPAEAGGPAVPVATAVATNWCRRCNAPNPHGTRYCGNCGSDLSGVPDYSDRIEPGIGAEVWVSAIVGLIMMLIGRNFFRWVLTTVTGGSYETNVAWQTGERAGQTVNYWDLQGFVALQDMAFFLFGLAMVLEAIVLIAVHRGMRAKRPLLVLALSITIAATALNLLVAVRLLGIGLLPFMSLLAVAFGGYIAAYEWRLYRHFQPATARA